MQSFAQASIRSTCASSSLRPSAPCDPDLVDRGLHRLVDLMALLAHDLERLEVREKLLGQPVDLGLRYLSACEDAKVDDDLRASLHLVLENHGGVTHVLLIPRGAPT